MTPTPSHQCYPLWVAGRAIATCRIHYGQPLGVTAAPTPVGAR